MLCVYVFVNGMLDLVEVCMSSGCCMFDSVVVVVVKCWIFVFVKCGDEVVDGWVNVLIDFKLG